MLIEVSLLGSINFDIGTVLWEFSKILIICTAEIQKSVPKIKHFVCEGDFQCSGEFCHK